MEGEKTQTQKISPTNRCKTFAVEKCFKEICIMEKIQFLWIGRLRKAKLSILRVDIQNN